MWLWYSMLVWIQIIRFTINFVSQIPWNFLLKINTNVLDGWLCNLLLSGSVSVTWRWSECRTFHQFESWILEGFLVTTPTIKSFQKLEQLLLLIVRDVCQFLAIHHHLRNLLCVGGLCEIESLGHVHIHIYYGFHAYVRIVDINHGRWCHYWGSLSLRDHRRLLFESSSWHFGASCRNSHCLLSFFLSLGLSFLHSLLFKL